jgi:hypothetical protein
MKEKNIDIWKKKLDWIAKNGGMALLNTHPDYMSFEGTELSIEEYRQAITANFLSISNTNMKGSIGMYCQRIWRVSGWRSFILIKEYSSVALIGMISWASEAQIASELFQVAKTP